MIPAVRSKEREYNRLAVIKCVYGLTPEAYKKMIADQSNKCAICSKSETRVVKGGLCELSIDHCHDTGKIRELLCIKYNTGLGMFENNPAALRMAADYLEKHKQNG